MSEKIIDSGSEEKSSERESEICFICQAPIQSPRLLECLHSFCLHCIQSVSLTKYYYLDSLKRVGTLWGIFLPSILWLCQSCQNYYFYDECLFGLAGLKFLKVLPFLIAGLIYWRFGLVAIFKAGDSPV